MKISSIAWLAAASLIYFVLGRFGMATFALEPGNITLIWLPSAIALVMCIQWGWQAVPFIILSSFLANYSDMFHPPASNLFLHTAINAVADGSTGIVGMYLFKRYLPDGLNRTQDLLPFGLWVCLFPATICSIIISTSLAGGGYITWQGIGSFTSMLILGDSLGILMVYQVCQGWRESDKISLTESYWLSASVLVMLFILVLGFTKLPAMIYFTVPILLVLSFNTRLLGISSITSAAMLCILAAATHNAGPFIADTTSESYLRLMAFVFSSALTTLGIALQNRQIIAAEYNSNTKYRIDCVC
jgi:integral membrane sensor domain MASE1